MLRKPDHFIPICETCMGTGVVGAIQSGLPDRLLRALSARTSLHTTRWVNADGRLRALFRKSHSHPPQIKQEERV